jgi:hypothetical protein
MRPLPLPEKPKGTAITPISGAGGGGGGETLLSSKSMRSRPSRRTSAAQIQTVHTDDEGDAQQQDGHRNQPAGSLRLVVRAQDAHRPGARSSDGITEAKKRLLLERRAKGDPRWRNVQPGKLNRMAADELWGEKVLPAENGAPERTAPVRTPAPAPQGEGARGGSGAQSSVWGAPGHPGQEGHLPHRWGWGRAGRVGSRGGEGASADSGASTVQRQRRDHRGPRRQSHLERPGADRHAGSRSP